MLDFRNALEVRHDDNATFSDFKTEAIDFTRDTFTMALDKDVDYLYVGFYKPINAIYLDLATANTNAGTLDVDYYNGTEFTNVINLYDETASFTRNGFITWDRNLINESETTIDSTEKFWYRIRPSVTHSSTIFNTLNILFSDDQSLKLKFTEVLSKDFLAGENNHNKIHAAVRDEIIETLRRKGLLKLDGKSDSTSNANLTPFDLHDIFEVRAAACYLALYTLFFDFSDDPEDIWMAKAKVYKGMYEKNINLVRISIDVNDDGLVTESENLPQNVVRYISR